MRIAPHIEFAVSNATPADLEAIRETRRAIEDLFYDEIDALESAMLDEMTPRGRELLLELEQARWRRGAAFTEAMFTLGRRCATMIERIEAQSERDLAAAGKGPGCPGGPPGGALAE